MTDFRKTEKKQILKKQIAVRLIERMCYLQSENSLILFKCDSHTNK